MSTRNIDLAAIQDLYDRGLYLQAFHAASQYGPLAEWKGTAPRILAGRLAANLGNAALGRWLHIRAYREDPEDPPARYSYARLLLERRGPLAAWRFLHRHLHQPDAPPEIRSEWFALLGFVAGMLRDFDTAEEWLNRAEQEMPGNPWVWIERSNVLEFADRYSEALEAARKTQEIRPWYRAGIQAIGHALQLLGRDQEALDLLTVADTMLESAVVVSQLLGIQLELGMHEEADRTVERLLQLAPIREEEFDEWLFGVRSDIRYHLGDVSSAIDLGRKARSPFFQKVAQNMESAPSDAKRVCLPVGFVRQHHMTCAPATLSTLSRFWDMPADHLAVAEEICYDGTPDHSERAWAMKNGYVAREFRVTWESAVALIDRGIPFTLATVHPGDAHLQAVIGYDARRRTYLIRDPYFRNLGEGLADDLAESYRSSGPRGMAMAPASHAELLEGIDLPEAELYDHYFQIQCALMEHRREDAGRLYEQMSALTSGSEAEAERLVLWARRSMAAYDANPVEALAATDRLLELFPQDANLRLIRLSLLRELANREERLEYLRRLSGESLPARRFRDPRSLTKQERDAEIALPLIWQQYAQELSADAREHDRAIHLLRRSLRRRPADPGSLYVLAGILWDRREFADAIDLYRFAACLEDKDEVLNRAYFGAARYIKQTARALDFLENRFRRLGPLSSQPARTLYRALDDLDQSERAFEVLDEALQMRPEDGDLILFAAEERARHGQFEAAEELLARGQGRTSRVAWLRASAALASYRDEPVGALAMWREALEMEPLAMDAHRAAARLIAETESTGAVHAHFLQYAQRFPHHYGLHQLWAEWLRNEDDLRGQEEVLRNLMRINPAYGWTRREMAMNLVRQRRTDEALVQAEMAVRLEPWNTASHAVRAEVDLVAGRRKEAIDGFKESIRLSVDNDWAMGELISACNSSAETREALRFVEAELEAQTVYGDGLLAFRRIARTVLEGDELFAVLRRGLDARPDLWHAWSAAIRQAIDVGRTEEAVQLAEGATARFPLLPALWLDLAAARQARPDPEGERAALRQALQLSPGWSAGVRQLCSSYERQGEFEESRRLLDKAIARDPLDPMNHAYLAETLWKMGRREEALDRIKAATRLAPDYDWSWDMMRGWAAELHRPEEANEALRDLVRRRPREARCWLILARNLEGADLLEERLTALDRALDLSPRLFEAHDFRAQLLAEAGRFDEAIEACAPTGVADLPPQLKGRRAWIEAQRGCLQQAVAKMEEVLRQEPLFYSGWLQLARWHEEAGDLSKYEEAARMLTRLAPQDALAAAVLGDACQKNGNRSEAKEAFRRATQISPDFTWGPTSLLELQIEDQELDQAMETLQTIRPHLEAGWPEAYEARIAALRKDAETACACLRALLLAPDEDSQPLRATAAMLDESGMREEARAVYEELLERPEARPEVGELWARAAVRSRQWNAGGRIARLLQAQAGSAVAAASAYVEELADAGQHRRAKGFVRANRSLLRLHDATWGSVCYACLMREDFKGTVAWSSDWQERREVKPWMLLNRAMALRHLRRHREAVETHRGAMELPHDHTTVCHQVWIAADAALEGDVAAAAEQLASVQTEALQPYYQFLQLVTQAVCTASEQKAAGFEAARSQIAAARQCYPKYHSDPVALLLFRKAVRRIAAHSDSGLRALFWRLWQEL